MIISSLVLASIFFSNPMNVSLKLVAMSHNSLLCVWLITTRGCWLGLMWHAKIFNTACHIQCRSKSRRKSRRQTDLRVANFVIFWCHPIHPPQTLVSFISKYTIYIFTFAIVAASSIPGVMPLRSRNFKLVPFSSWKTGQEHIFVSVWYY